MPPTFTPEQVQELQDAFDALKAASADNVAAVKAQGEADSAAAAAAANQSAARQRADAAAKTQQDAEIALGDLFNGLLNPPAPQTGGGTGAGAGGPTETGAATAAAGTATRIDPVTGATVPA